MYIAFCGMSFSGKKQYQDLTIDYLKIKHGILPGNILAVSDPKSTKLGIDIIALDEKQYQINLTESGALYIAASCNVYNTIISKAKEGTNIICRGSFTEVLGYQGNLLGDQGFDWQMVKDFYSKILSTTHLPQTIRYPDIIFFCVNSYEKAQIYMQSLHISSFETNLTQEQYEKYSAKMLKAFQIISEDKEFTSHTKLVLVDETKALSYSPWDEVIKPQIDMLMSGETLSFSNYFADYNNG